MSRILFLVLAVAAVASTGCGSTFTSLRKVDDTTYVLTRTENGFFRTFGTVFSCTPSGETLKCTEVGGL
jgi:hypothetical protein